MAITKIALQPQQHRVERQAGRGQSDVNPRILRHQADERERKKHHAPPLAQQQAERSEHAAGHRDRTSGEAPDREAERDGELVRRSASGA